MAIQLKLKKNESVERALKRLKKILDKEGIIKTLRDQRYFEKRARNPRAPASGIARVVVQSRCKSRSRHFAFRKRPSPVMVRRPCFIDTNLN